MQKKIYVADDEKNIRDLIMSFLKNDGFTVKTFEDGRSLYETFMSEPADMLIIDIMMPEMDGLSLCTKIREKYNVPIIIVSARDSELDRITGITIGSDDYLVKPFSPIELVARVKAIFRRMQFDQGSYEEHHTLDYGDLSISVNKRTAYCKDQPLDLTPTEFALMVYLFENQERAISREELLKNVWKFDFDVDTRATDDVVKRLRKKLNGSNVKISAVWGFGFKLEQEPSNNGK